MFVNLQTISGINFFRNTELAIIQILIYILILIENVALL